MAKKRIDEKTRQGVLAAHSKGVTGKIIAEQFGISVSSVKRIVKGKGSQDRQKRVTGRTAGGERLKKLEDLERRINLLEKRILELRAGRIF